LEFKDKILNDKESLKSISL